MAFVARYSRREDGGYDASYGKGSKKLEAVMLQDGKLWKVTSGFASGGVASSAKLGEVKEAWGKLAESAYGAGNTQTSSLSVPAGPPKLPGPPSLRKSYPLSVSAAPRVGPPSLKIARGIEPNPRLSTVDPNPVIEGPTLQEWWDQMIEKNPSIQVADAGVATCPECHQPNHGWHKGEDGTYKPPCRCAMPNDDGYEPDPFDPRMYEADFEQTFRVLTPIGVLDKLHAWMLRNPDYVTTESKLDPLWESVRDTLYRTTGYAEYRPERWEKP